MRILEFTINAEFVHYNELFHVYTNVFKPDLLNIIQFNPRPLGRQAEKQHYRALMFWLPTARCEAYSLIDIGECGDVIVKTEGTHH